MNRRLLVLLLPVLLSASRVDSTEVPFELTPQEAYQLRYQPYSEDFQVIPANLSAFAETVSYRDADLKQVAGKLAPYKKLNVVHLFVNQGEQMVFQLSDGTYIPASTRLFFDDALLHEESVEQTLWLKKGFTLLSGPLLTSAKEVTNSPLQAYQPITVRKYVETPVGSFAEIPGHGWVNRKDLSEEDNRMEQVQDILQTKYNKDNLAVYVKQLSSGQTAGVHLDKTFYAASVAKLPILYYVQEQVNAGKVQLTDRFVYSPESMAFKGAYQVGGSGSLSKTPDQQQYSLVDLIHKTAKESDNVASNLLAYYVTQQYSDDFYRVVESELDQSWNMVSRETTVTIAGQMMEALYRQDGLVLDSLRTTQFDQQRISKDIPVPVAHKIGDADEFKHDVAVIYGKEPFILSIFTEKASYDDITQIANDIYGILK